MSSCLTFPDFLEEYMVHYSGQCPTKSSFDFGTALQNVYPLLHIIFKHLRYKDLKSASLVSRGWNKCAWDEIVTRSNISWAYSKLTGEEITPVLLSENCRHNSTAFAFIFYNYDIVAMKMLVNVEGKDTSRRVSCN